MHFIIYLVIVCLCLSAQMAISSTTGSALASPSPTIISVGIKQQETSDKILISPDKTTPFEENTISPKDSAPLRVNNAEKLKRGLASFINQMNPGSFFVPAQQTTAVQAADLKSSEPAAIIFGDPSTDVLINKPTRLAHTRPIGGPLRWGRR